MLNTHIPPEILQVALHSLIAEEQNVRGKIQQVKRLLNGSSAHSRKRHLSPEARAKMVAAQKKRWAAYRKAKKLAGT